MTLLRHVAPEVTGRKAEKQALILGAIQPVYDAVLNGVEINTPLRVAHFTAQIAHESDGFCTTEEYASGDAYEGRGDLGNTQPGDGRRFKGRGLIQLTGRYNYAWAGEVLGINLVADPERAAEPVLSLRIACLYWQDRDLNRLADQDSILRITKRINGGYNGLADRERYLAKAKAYLAEHGRLTFTPRPWTDRLREAVQGWFR